MVATPQIRLLVLGGTEFVGRAVVEEALARNWSVTVFNRGTNPTPEQVQALRGDRTEKDGLAALEDGSWDLVVDTWSWAPSAVREAAELLADRISHYAYVSSRSVYEFPTPAGAAEDAPLVDPEGDDTSEYAAIKLESERSVSAVMGERALLARAGLIIGPYENIGRLPWWLRRIARGGRVLAPGPAELGLQFIDVRDLAAWLLDASVAGRHGPYNVVSEPGHATMRGLLETCVEVTGSDAALRWVDPETVLEAGAQPWSDLPIWLPPGEMHEAMHQANVDAAMTSGLRCRPTADTVASTWDWLQDVGDAPQRADRPSVGLDPDVEAAILRSTEARTT